MHLLIDISDALHEFVVAESDSECSGASLHTHLQSSIEQELNNVADIFEGLDEGIMPEEIPALIEDGYFEPKTYLQNNDSMEPDALMSAELFDVLLKEIAAHRVPNTVPTRTFKLAGVSLLKVEMYEFADDSAMEEWVTRREELEGE